MMSHMIDTVALKRLVRIAALLGALTTPGKPAAAAQITVMSGGAPQEVLAAITPQFEKRTRNTVKYSFAVITALRQRLDAGEKADVVLLPMPVIDDYVNAGKMRADGRSELGSVGITVIVKQGERSPNISTPERFRRALIAARSIVFATPGATPSGTHMAKVIEQLGIADSIRGKTIHRPALSGGVDLVANGVADIGMYPASEVAQAKGITLVGPLPAELQLDVTYGAAVTTDNEAPEIALSFVKFLADPSNRMHWKKGGFDPP
jgi:molybdate transport system substrate-binding protein